MDMDVEPTLPDHHLAASATTVAPTLSFEDVLSTVQYQHVQIAAQKALIRDAHASVEKLTEEILCASWNWRVQRRIAVVRVDEDGGQAFPIVKSLGDPYIALGRNVAAYEDFVSFIYHNPRLLARAIFNVKERKKERKKE